MIMLGIDINNLKPAERVIANAMIVGGIVFFSLLTSIGGLPTIDMLWTAFIGSMLAFLTQIKVFFEDEDKDNRHVPKEYEKNKKKPPKLGMLI